MLRVKIFLRLKCTEILYGSCEIIKFVLIVACMLFVLAGLIFLLGYFTCLAIRVPPTLGNIENLGIPIFGILVSTIVLYIASKHWLVSNWKKAGRLAMIRRDDV